MSAQPFNEVFVDAKGICRCEVGVSGVSPGESIYPAMVMVEEIAPCARRLADILIRAARVADESSRTVGGETRG